MAISDTFHCNKCDKRFSSFLLLNKHRSTHRNVCTICGKEFGNRHYIKKHIEAVHKQTRNYRCNFCDKTYTDSTPLRLHKEIHSADLSRKEYNCSQCESAFYTRSSLEAHVRKVHNKTLVTCKICSVAVDKYSLKQHSKRHYDLSAKAHQCGSCSKVCGSEKDLKTHSKVHGSKEKVYHCEDCPKSYSQREYLKKHIRYKHKNSEEGKWKCSICDKYFAQSGGLHNHLKIHSENLYQCSICDKKFTAKSNLKTHIYLHTGKMPFECDLCEKSYRAKLELKVHRDYKHFNIKPFLCQHCDRGFIVRTDLKMHMEVSHSPCLSEPQKDPL